MHLKESDYESSQLAMQIALKVKSSAQVIIQEIIGWIYEHSLQTKKQPKIRMVSGLSQNLQSE